MKKLIAVIPVLVALAAPVAAHADDQVAVRVGGQTLYLATGGSVTYKLKRTVPGVTMHRSYVQSAMTLSGTVRDTSTIPMGGVPIAAQIASVTGVGWHTVATGVSDVNGLFSVRVPKGDSRLVRLFAGSAFLTFKELASPTLRIYVHARKHGVLRFAGSIRIDWTGQPRPTVEIDSRTLNGWATLVALRVGKFGTFGYTYHSPPQTKGFKFKFRLATLSDPNWSWAASPLASAVVR